MVPKGNPISLLLARIKECSRSRDLKKGQTIHAKAVANGLDSNIYISSSLVNMYAKCNSIDEARQVFERMRNRDVVSWNTVILGYAENGKESLALEMLDRMEAEAEAEADALTFISAAKACIRLARKAGKGALTLDKALWVHARAAKHSLDVMDTALASTLIDMYGKCGSFVDARRVFDRMVKHDVVAWTALILSQPPPLALHLFHCMEARGGCSPNPTTFLSALKACSSSTDVRDIHLRAHHLGCDTHPYVACSLITMYARFGSMSEAERVFERVKQPDVVSWNAIISGYVDNGEQDLALERFAAMPVHVKRDAATFSAALNACMALASDEPPTYVNGRALKLASLRKGARIHREAQDSKLEGAVAQAVITMYAACGSLGDAHMVFETLYSNQCQSSAAALAALMSGYVQIGQPEIALHLLHTHHPCQPDARLPLFAAFKACMALADSEPSCSVEGIAIKLSSLETCREICSRPAVRELASDPYVACTLVSLYSRCGSMSDARGAFEAVSRPDVALWNALMAGYADNDEQALALEVYEEMKDKCEADCFTYSTALNACAGLADKEGGGDVKLQSLGKGMAIHFRAGHLCEADMYVGSSLVDMYGKCGSFSDAWKAFMRMEVVDVVLITSMILAGVETGQGELALGLYSTMSSVVKDDSGAVGAALQACVALAEQEEGSGGEMQLKLSSLERGMKVHCGLDSDLEQSVANVLINLYGACGAMLDARAVFDRLERRSLESWTVLMAGYVRNGEVKTALDLYLYLVEARQLMLDRETMACGLKACSLLADVQAGKAIHAQLCRQGSYDSADDLVLLRLVDMYGRCGCMNDAQQVVDSVSTRDSLVWSSLIAGYSRQGKPDKVFLLVDTIEQENIALNSSSYASILSLCSHAGLVKKGKEVFIQMQSKLTPAVEHHSCMVDMLNRANQVEEAVRLAQTVPCTRANASVWRSILSASSQSGNTSMAHIAYHALLQLDHKDTSSYVLMANMSH